MLPSRRAFLTGATALSTTALLPRMHAQAAAGAPTAADAPGVNRDTRLKFNPDGTRRPFAGNTVLCHLPAQCPMRDAMAQFHTAMRQSSFAARLGLTSVDSYHMTLFPGADDDTRMANAWPAYVPLDATMQQCNDAVADRMRRASLHCELPFRVCVDERATNSYPRACTLRMKAVDSREEKKLRFVRDRLAELYGFRRPDHARYGFHITLSYQIADFTAQEAKAFHDMREQYVHTMIAAQPVLELGNPEFCTFPDMFRFDPVVLLRCG